jgi:hypothetical protein
MVPTGASRCTLIVPTDIVDICGVMVVQVPARALFHPLSKQSRIRDKANFIFNLPSILPFSLMQAIFNIQNPRVVTSQDSSSHCHALRFSQVQCFAMFSTVQRLCLFINFPFFALTSILSFF